jgi:hypothetical protein
MITNPAELAAAIQANGQALQAARAGTNGLLLAALNQGRKPEAEWTPTGEDLNAVLLLIPDSHYARYMRDEFVDPALVKLHWAIKAATDAALAEDRARAATRERGAAWPVEDDSLARAAAARRGGAP